MALAVVVVSGCRERPVPVTLTPTFGSNVVAVVGDNVITTEVFAREVARRGASLTKEQKEALLESLIKTEAVYQQALKAGFDKDPEMAARIRRFLATAYEEKQRGTFKPTNPTPAELEEYLRLHTKEFTVPEQIRVAGIFMKVSRKAVPEKKEEARKKAEEILAVAKQEAAKQPSFGDLARQFSEDQATRYQGGDSGPMTPTQVEQRWDKEVSAAVLGLKQPGDFSPVVEATDGLWIFKLIEHRPAAVKPLAEVREVVAYRVGREKEAQAEKEFSLKMKSGLRVEINRPLVDSINPPAAATETTPPSLPGR